MNRSYFASGLIVPALCLCGCSSTSNTEQGAGLGGLLGAGTGAIIGSATGHTGAARSLEQVSARCRAG